MPLYRCTKCDVVENTACGGFWQQQMKAHEDGVKHEPLCSQCDPEIGEWHGKFPRQGVTSAWLLDSRGFLWRPKEAETVKHLGPFVPVTV